MWHACARPLFWGRLMQGTKKASGQTPTGWAARLPRRSPSNSALPHREAPWMNICTMRRGAMRASPGDDPPGPGLIPMRASLGWAGRGSFIKPFVSHVLMTVVFENLHLVSPRDRRPCRPSLSENSPQSRSKRSLRPRGRGRRPCPWRGRPPPARGRRWSLDGPRGIQSPDRPRGRPSPEPRCSGPART